MWDKIAIAVGSAVVAGITYLIADEVVKETSGQRIHEHVYGWWRQVYSRIETWVSENQNLVVARIVGTIAIKLDDAIITAKKNVTFKVTAETDQGRKTITEEVIPAHELADKFPQLRSQQEIVIESQA